MRDYIFLLSLGFNLSWVIALLWVQVHRGAHRHYIVVVEAVAIIMLLFETYREILILTWHLQPHINNLRTLMYSAEHVLLGIVLREALLYVEKYQKARKSHRRVR